MGAWVGCGDVKESNTGADTGTTSGDGGTNGVDGSVGMDGGVGSAVDATLGSGDAAFLDGGIDGAVDGEGTPIPDAGTSTACGAPCPANGACRYSVVPQLNEGQACPVACANGVIGSVTVTYASNCAPTPCPDAAAGCVGTSSCTIQPGNTVCGGDPCLNVAKAATMDIVCFTSIACGAACPVDSTCEYSVAPQVNEGQACAVGCATGAIQSASVTYASNCAPTACPDAATGCVGASSCTSQPGNTACGGDPCLNVAKASRLDIVCQP
jgi:hypothetical protein